MHYVYILRCADDTLYVGETRELDSRMIKHHEGSASTYTAQRRPVTRLYSEEYSSRDVALARERQIKGWTRAKKEALPAQPREAYQLHNTVVRPVTWSA